MPMDESLYRKRVQDAYSQIESALDAVDPDLVECTVSQGSLSLVLKDGSKCILSAQPSVRQLWLAVASMGVAFHFNWDEAARSWKDDRGQGIELNAYLQGHLAKTTGVQVTW